MTNSQESNYFIPALSAIAGLGAIFTVVSPLVLNNNQMSQLFIDNFSVQYALVIAIITAVSAIWYASSNQSYEIFPAGKAILFKLITGFSIIAITFYALKLLAGNEVMNSDFASILQMGIYIFGYVLLGSIVGLLLRDSFGGYRYQKLQQEKYDRLRETLFKSGLITVNLEIISFNQRPFSNSEPQLFGAHNVIFRTKDGKFSAILSSDFSQVLFSEKIIENIKTKTKNGTTK